MQSEGRGGQWVTACWRIYRRLGRSPSLQNTSRAINTPKVIQDFLVSKENFQEEKIKRRAFRWKNNGRRLDGRPIRLHLSSDGASPKQPKVDQWICFDIIVCSRKCTKFLLSVLYVSTFQILASAVVKPSSILLLHNPCH